MGLFSRRKTKFVDSDVLVIGGGMAGCGATYEARHWGRDLKIVCVEKANIERSGAVAQGLYAINCYMGMQWDENQPEDHVRYARNDLMGLVREDLGYDIARHVDSSVHKFEEWGLPMMKDPETGRYMREGKWQIMIHGESYKPIVAEAARKAATEVYNRIMVTHLLMDKSKEGRVAGAVGFNVRTGDFYVFRAKAVIVAAGGASHIYKPRAVGEGMGRTWYAPWSSASAYALPIEVGAKMTQMENRIVLTRFKDGYGPVGAYFLHLKTYTENAYGEEYESTWYENTKELVGDYIDRHPVPTCLRNHAFLEEMKAGRGPIRMVTKEARHDDRASGRLGIAGHRSQTHEPRADHVRAVRHGLPCHVFRRVGQRSGGLFTRRVPVGLQPHDDRRRIIRCRRHYRRHRAQVLVRLLHGRPHCCQGGGELHQ
jgi:adenylylsulfate reductase subunit A